MFSRSEAGKQISSVNRPVKFNTFCARHLHIHISSIISYFGLFFIIIRNHVITCLFVANVNP